VVVDVLIAQRKPEHSLPHQRHDLMLDQLCAATVAEASRETIDQPDPSIRRPQKQRTGVRCDRSSVKPSDHHPAIYRCKFKQFWATLCRHRGISLDQSKSLLHNNFLRVRAPMHLVCVRYPG
jgi:hypothetical protein